MSKILLINKFYYYIFSTNMFSPFVLDLKRESIYFPPISGEIQMPFQMWVQYINIHPYAQSEQNYHLIYLSENTPEIRFDFGVSSEILLLQKMIDGKKKIFFNLAHKNSRYCFEKELTDEFKIYIAPDYFVTPEFVHLNFVTKSGDRKYCYTTFS